MHSINDDLIENFIPVCRFVFFWMLFMMMYQILGKSYILEYLTVMLCDGYDDFDSENDSDSDEDVQEEQIEKSFYYEQSKKIIPSYIQRLSSTYFKTVTGDNKKLLKQKKRKRQRKKRKKKENMFQSFCIQNNPSPYKQNRYQKLDKNSNIEQNNKIDIEALKKPLQSIEERVQKLEKYAFKQVSAKGKQILSQSVIIPQGGFNFGEQSILDVSVSNVLGGLDDDPQNEVNNPIQSGEQIQECLICFDEKSDAVFMNCGHGGICYQCAIDVWKKSAECYLCRKEIIAVYQLDCKNGKYFEIIAETKRVEKEKEEENSSSVSISSESSIDYENYEYTKKGSDQKGENSNIQKEENIRLDLEK